MARTVTLTPLDVTYASSAGQAGDGLLQRAMKRHLNPVTEKIVKIGEGRVEEGIVRPRAKRGIVTVGFAPPHSV
jgi:hypothetical protein